jgi:hypothetical protein
MNKNRILLVFPLLLSLYATCLAQWVDLNANIPGPLYTCKVKPADVNYFIVGGESGIYRSTNHGTSWTRILPNSADSVTYNRTTFRHLHQIGNEWLAAGKNRVTGAGVVFKTGSSGTTWTLCNAVPYAVNVVFGNLNDITAYCDQGYKCVSNDGGSTWTSIYSGYPQALHSRSNVAGQYVSSDSLVMRDLTNFSVEIAHGAKGAEAFGSRAVAVDSEAIFIKDGGPWYQTTAYLSPMDGRCIEAISSTKGLIGTATGVFLGGGANMQIWEYQPSSAGFVVNDISALPNYWAIAVCQGGQVIRNYQAHTEGIPYLRMDFPNGGCAGQPITFTNNSWNLHSYQWFVNGTQMATTFNFTYTFATPGTYAVRLIGTNGILKDTMDINFNVVPPSPTNFAYSIDNTLHCKLGVSNVSIPSSMLTFNYELVKIPGNTVVASAIGNGGPLVLSTGLLTDTTHYRIKVSSIVAACMIYHIDTITVYVENTDAAYRSGLINASLGEAVDYYNKSKSASTYEWYFGNGANITSSSVSAPPPITYAATGDPLVRLVAISAMGCRDTLDSLPVFVYDTTLLPERVMGLDFDSMEPGSGAEATSVVDTVSGAIYTYIISNNRLSIATEYGRSDSSYNPTNYPRGVVVKHDRFGVLKWRINVNIPPHLTGDIMCVDGLGNLYFNSVRDGGDTALVEFVDGTKDITTQAALGINFSIYKVSSNGQMLWGIRVATSYAPWLKADGRGNLYTFSANAAFYNRSHVKLVGGMGNLSNGQFPGYVVHKFSPSGAYRYRVALESPASARGTIDESGAILLVTENPGKLVDRDSTYMVLPWNPGVGNGFGVNRGSMIRLDSTGHFDWTRGHSYPACTVCLGQFSGRFNSIVTGKGNNVFFDALTGITPGNHRYDEFRIENGIGGIDTVWFGLHFWGMYDSLGVLQWMAQEPHPYTQICEGATNLATDRAGNLILSHQGRDTLMLPSQGMISDTLTESRQVVFSKYSRQGVVLDVTQQTLLDSTHFPLHATSGFSFPRVGRLNLSRGGLPITTSAKPNDNSDTLIYFAAGETFNVIDNGASIISQIDWNDCAIPEIYVNAPACTQDSITLSFHVNPSFQIYAGNVYHIHGMVLDGYFHAGQPMLTLNSALTSHTVTLPLPANLPSNTAIWFEVESTEPPLQGVSSKVMVQIAPTPIDTILNTCMGTPVFLQANAGTGYSWTPPNWVSNPTNANTTANPPATSIVVCSVTQNCGIIQDTFRVQVMPLPSLTAYGDTTICYGDTATLNSQSNSPVTWTPNLAISNPGIQNPQVWPNQTATYNVATQGSNGCISIDSILVNVRPQLIVNTGNDQDMCAGDSIQLNTTSSGPITWSPVNFISDPGILNPLVYPPVTTAYIATVHDPGSSCTKSDSLLVSVTVLPVNIALNGNLLETDQGYSYQWLFNGLPIPGATQASFIPTANGNYSVIQSALGCTDTSAVLPVTVTRAGTAAKIVAFQVHPNPTDGRIHLSIGLSGASLVSVRLLDMYGRDLGLLLSEENLLPGNYEYPYDLRTYGLAKGTYFLEANFDGEGIRRKVVLE